ncbi:hypothetical protein D3C79_937650 [compost metagenome]
MDRHHVDDVFDHSSIGGTGLRPKSHNVIDGNCLQGDGRQEYRRVPRNMGSRIDRGGSALLQQQVDSDSASEPHGRKIYLGGSAIRL